VKSHGPPEISRAAQKQTEQQSKQKYRQQAGSALARITGVRKSKKRGEQNGRGPESHSSGKRVLQVSTEREFFSETDDDEGESPLCHRGEDCRSMDREASEVESAKKKYPKKAVAETRGVAEVHIG
jgi:hypothetical protein